MGAPLRDFKEWHSLINRAKNMRIGGMTKHAIGKRLHCDWRTIQQKAEELQMKL